MNIFGTAGLAILTVDAERPAKPVNPVDRTARPSLRTATHVAAICLRLSIGPMIPALARADGSELCYDVAETGFANHRQPTTGNTWHPRLDSASALPALPEGRHLSRLVVSRLALDV